MQDDIIALVPTCPYDFLVVSDDWKTANTLYMDPWHKKAMQYMHSFSLSNSELSCSLMTVCLQVVYTVL